MMWTKEEISSRKENGIGVVPGGPRVQSNVNQTKELLSLMVHLDVFNSNRVIFLVISYFLGPHPISLASAHLSGRITCSIYSNRSELLVLSPPQVVLVVQ